MLPPRPCCPARCFLASPSSPHMGSQRSITQTHSATLAHAERGTFCAGSSSPSPRVSACCSSTLATTLPSQARACATRSSDSRAAPRTAGAPPSRSTPSCRSCADSWLRSTAARDEPCCLLYNKWNARTRVCPPSHGAGCTCELPWRTCGCLGSARAQHRFRMSAVPEATICDHVCDISMFGLPAGPQQYVCSIV